MRKASDVRCSLDLTPKVCALIDKHLACSSQRDNDVLLETQDLVGFKQRVRAVVLSGIIPSRFRNTHAARALFSSIASLISSNSDLSNTVVSTIANPSRTVDTAVDHVGDPALWLLDIVQHERRRRVGHDASKLGRRLLFHLSRQRDTKLEAYVDTHDSSHSLGLVVQGHDFSEGKGGRDVDVADEDVLRHRRAQDGVTD